MKIIPRNYTEQEITRAFPDVEPGFTPLGSRIIVQLRSAKSISQGGIILPDEVRDAELWNTQIAKVRAMGPSAFRYRSGDKEGEIFKEGAGCEVGNYVRIPKFNQDRWVVEVETGEKNALGHSITSSVLFMLVNDLDILAKKNGNPLEVKAYI